MSMSKSGEKMVRVAGELVELVEMDGVGYVDKGGDMVEYVPVEAEVEAYGRKVRFAEGGRYENYFGSYEVCRIGRDGKMEVEYVEAKRCEVSVGVRYAYALKAQAEALAAEARRKEQEMVREGVAKLGPVDMPLVKWIAETGTIRVQMPEDAVPGFEEKYERLTGVKPDAEYVRVKEGYWGVGLVAEFPQPPDGSDVKFPAYAKLHVGDGSVRVWSNEFVWGMLKAGMRLGKNEKVLAAA